MSFLWWEKFLRWLPPRFDVTSLTLRETVKILNIEKLLEISLKYSQKCSEFYSNSSELDQFQNLYQNFLKNRPKSRQTLSKYLSLKFIKIPVKLQKNVENFNENCERIMGKL